MTQTNISRLLAAAVLAYCGGCVVGAALGTAYVLAHPNRQPHLADMGHRAAEAPAATPEPLPAYWQGEIERAGL